MWFGYSSLKIICRSVGNEYHRKADEHLNSAGREGSQEALSVIPIFPSTLRAFCSRKTSLFCLREQPFVALAQGHRGTDSWVERNRWLRHNPSL